MKIQLRRDAAANWTTDNPTLASGELGVETDTLKIKVGDGSTAWTALAYLGAGSGSSGAIETPFADYVINLTTSASDSDLGRGTKLYAAFAAARAMAPTAQKRAAIVVDLGATGAASVTLGFADGSNIVVVAPDSTAQYTGFNLSIVQGGVGSPTAVWTAGSPGTLTVTVSNSANTSIDAICTALQAIGWAAPPSDGGLNGGIPNANNYQYGSDANPLTITSTSAGHGVVLDCEYMDLIGLDRDDTIITSQIGNASCGTVEQTANDVQIKNLTIENANNTCGLPYDSTAPAAYWPDATWNSGNNVGSGPLTVIENVTFCQTNNHYNVLDTRAGRGAYEGGQPIEYAGTYTKIKGNIGSGGYCGLGYGVTAGSGALISGKLTNVIGDIACGCNFATSSGVCTGGAAGQISGTLKNATGRIACGGFYFGGGGGEDTNGNGGALTGTFIDCMGTFGAGGVGGWFGQGAPGTTAGGAFIRCNADSSGFPDTAGNFFQCTTAGAHNPADS